MGLYAVIKTGAPNSSGDCAMCQVPIPYYWGGTWYYWGGTWIAAYKGTKNPNAAKEMVKYMCTDDDFLNAYTEKYGEVVGNLNVQKAHEDDFSEPFLGGQNQYKMFCEMVKAVDGSLTCAADKIIRPLYKEACTAYAHGEKTKEEAIAAFKEQVANTLGIK